MRNVNRYLVSVALLCLCRPPVTADVTDGNNYIRHDVYTSPTLSVSENDGGITICTVEYYDGLGRRVQTVSRRAGSGQLDVADFMEYNAMGIPFRKWSPVNGSGDGAFLDVPSCAASPGVNPYNNPEPYALYEYEASPSPRLTQAHEAGVSWHGHAGKSTTYGLVSGTVHAASVARFKPTVNGVSYSGQWLPGELDMSEKYDEDGKCVVTFTDKHGNLVMETDEFGKLVGTYYVYDQMDLLRYVIPPKLADILIGKGTGTSTADTDQDMENLAYIYKYDTSYRLSSRKLPGREVVRMLYDKTGTPVFTQDGLQAEDDVWLYHVCDNLGRNTHEALIPSSRLNENNVGSNCYRIDYNDHFGYSLFYNLIASDSILSRNYYDGYGLLLTESADNALAYSVQSGYDTCYTYARCPERSAQGMLTGRMSRTLPLGTSSQTLYSSYYYDHNGNVVQSHEQNLLGGHEHYYYRLSFTGKPLSVMHVHETADTTVTDVYQYTYDNMERLLTATVSHDGGAAVTLASNTYDSLGRLSEQALGSHANGVVDYTYNVRGWTQSVTSPHFSQTLYYEQPCTGATPCYNGNVSAVEWSALDAMAAATPTGHRYTFSYDGANRLTAAGYNAAGEHLSWNGYLIVDGDEGHDYSTSYSYDLNGNVTSLSRRGVNGCVPVGDHSVWAYGDIDDLTLTYNGNQLKKVTDHCPDLTYAGAMDFKDGADKSAEYLWDANGNMTRDRNKKIWSIGYNALNLPEEIQHYDGHIVRYTYAADGRKLRATYLVSNIAVMEQDGINLVGGSPDGVMGGGTIPFNPPGPLNPPGPVVPSGPTTYLTLDYCGNKVYRNGVLERTENDYGYLADSTYYYYIRDYQGNVRAVIDQNGALKEINNYYPYGGLMGAASAGVQPNKYGGKELDRQNGIDWYDFEARFQDPMLPMFTTQDPLAENNPGISPYAYCAGNPVRYIDPNGLMPKWNGLSGSNTGYTDSETGEVLTWEQVCNYMSYGNYNGPVSLKDEGSISSHDITPVELGIEWLTGKGERNRVFVNGDYMTELLKKHSHIDKIKKKISKNIGKGLLYSNRDGYSLGGIQGIPKYLQDYSTLFTGGLTGNLAVTYLGSYQLKWSVIKISGNTATVAFEVYNESKLSSGTRPPVIGYTDGWVNHVAPAIDRLVPHGKMSPTSQLIIWTEEIKLK